MSVYALRLVERNGTVVRTLNSADVLRVVDELNAAGEVVFNYPKYDPAGFAGQAADITTASREVQVLRDGAVYAWAVPLRKTASSGRGDVEVSAPGVGWFFGRRNADGPILERLVNPGFEAGLSPWTAAGVTTAIITSPRRQGANAVRLTQAVTGVDTHLRQDVLAVPGGQIGLLLVLAGFFYIESLTGPAIDSRGLFIEGKIGSSVKQFSFAPIDDATPRGSWQRVKTEIWIPPGETWDLDVRLYAPGGSIVWDALHLVAMDSVSVDVAGTDIAVMAGRIVNFIQDPTKGKSNLDIGVSTPVAGQTLVFPRAWQYVAHTPADRIISQELAPLGFDWSIQLTSTTKTFTTHAPRKGTDRSATLTLQLGVNIASYDFNEDASAVETDIYLQGAGSGPDREEAHVSDTSQLGGLVLQGVAAAPTGATIDQLDALAADRLDHGKRLVRLASITTYQGAGDLVTLLVVGDVVRVVINDGAVQVNSNYRIVRKELTPRTEQLKLTLNEDFGYRGGIQLPGVVRALTGIDSRITNLERTTFTPERPVAEEQAVFSQAGAVTVSASGIYPVRKGGALVSVVVSLVTAGSTGTTIKVLRNGTQVGVDATIPASATTATIYIGQVRLSAADRLQVQTTVAGTRASDLTVVLTMKG